jgi:hypothetical protein
MVEKAVHARANGDQRVVPRPERDCPLDLPVSDVCRQSVVPRHGLIHPIPEVAFKAVAAVGPDNVFGCGERTGSRVQKQGPPSGADRAGNQLLMEALEGRHSCEVLLTLDRV